MPPKKVNSKDGNDSDSDGLDEIANLKINDDNKLSEIVVGVERDIFDIEDVRENNSLFRGPYRDLKIDPIIIGKRSRYNPSPPIIASPFSPLSSGNNTPISIGSIGSYNTESSNKAIGFEKSKKHKGYEAKDMDLNMQRSKFCQECKPDSILFHPGRPPKSATKKQSKKKGGKTKKRKNKRKKTRRKYKR